MKFTGMRCQKYTHIEFAEINVKNAGNFLIGYNLVRRNDELTTSNPHNTYCNAGGYLNVLGMKPPSIQTIAINAKAMPPIT